MERARTIERRIAAYQRRIARMGRLINLIAVARLLVFFLGLVGFSFAFEGAFTAYGAGAVVVAIGGFLGLMVIHDRIYRFKTRCETLVALLEDDLARAEWRFGDIDYAHPIPFPADHPFANDLDLTGPYSMLKAIDNSFHARAKQRLRAWLDEIDPIAEIRARQAAITELTDRKGFRLRLALAARKLAYGQDVFGVGG